VVVWVRLVRHSHIFDNASVFLGVGCLGCTDDGVPVRQHKQGGRAGRRVFGVFGLIAYHVTTLCTWRRLEVRYVVTWHAIEPSIPYADQAFIL
jgi:hypothetical protein